MEFMKLIERITNKIKRYKSKTIDAVAQCYSCRNCDMIFTVPKKGYSAFTGKCNICGAEFVAMSNYGLITTFPQSTWNEHGKRCAEILSHI